MVYLKCVAAFAGLLLCIAGARADAEPLPEPLQALLAAAAQTGDESRFDAAVELISLTHPPEQVADAAARVSPEHGASARLRLGLPPAGVEAASSQVDAAPQPPAGDWRSRPAAIMRAVTNGQSDLWSGRAQIGFRQDSGNSDQLDYKLALEAERDLSVWGFQVRIEYSYAEADGAVGRDSFLTTSQIDREIGERWTVFSGVRYEQDALSGFDWTGLIDAGLGYAVLTGDTLAWRIQAGPAVRFVASPGEGTHTRAAAEFSSDLTWRLNPRLLFSAETRALASDQSRFEQRLELETELGEVWALQLAYRFQYEFEPEPGFTEEDSRTDLSLIRSF
jgi:putative salt-induced outer membrane protein